MHCTQIKIPGGGTAIVCGRGPRQGLKPCACGKPTTKLCDWKMPAWGNRTRRCSVGICDEHTFSPAKDKDLCPTHAREWKAYLARKGKV
jgi:hypothetical protein